MGRAYPEFSLPQIIGGWPVRAGSNGCCERGTSNVGAVDRGVASTTYETPSSEIYEGGRGPERISGYVGIGSTDSFRCQKSRSGSTRYKQS